MKNHATCPLALSMQAKKEASLGNQLLVGHFKKRLKQRSQEAQKSQGDISPRNKHHLHWVRLEFLMSMDNSQESTKSMPFMIET